jgi:3-oxosteroid 1-dehydrogenase
VIGWDEQFDVVCAGSGLGGLSAAITAAERGARVLVLEKFHLLGGVSALSSGQLWLGPNHLAQDAGIADSDEDAQAYLGHLSQGFATPERRRTFIERAQEAVRYFTDVIGIEMTVVRGLPDYYYPAIEGSKAEGRYIETLPYPAARIGEWADRVLTSPYGDGYSFTTSNEWVQMQLGGEHVGSCLQRHVAAGERCAGAGLAAAQVRAALDRGVTLRTSTSVAELVIEDGAVVGVVARDAQGERRIEAKLGVMLATGGYDWKPDLVRAFDALPEAGTMAPPSVTGDHLTLAARAGAIPIPSRAPAQSPIFVGYRVPGETIYGEPSFRMWLPGSPHCIAVNRAGKRFANDAFYPDVATKVGRFDGQEQGMPNWPAWIVFDQSMLDKYGLQPAWPGQPLPEGMAMSADTIEALGEKTGIDPAGLAATIARFNGFCETGVDKDFARGSVPWGRIMTGDPRLPNPNLGALATAPFYAVKIERVTMGVPTAGLPIDLDGRVIDAAGNPVRGLYAAGNSAAWLDIGGGYNSGIANTRGMLYGYLAALAMTGQAPIAVSDAKAVEPAC